MARRDFLFGAFRKMAPVLNPKSSKVLSPDLSSEVATERHGLPLTINLGRVADYPVDSKKEFASGSVVVESFPEGLRAKSERHPGRFYAITASAFGLLQLHTQEFWPENQVFSTMTYEPTIFNPTSEEK